MESNRLPRRASSTHEKKSPPRISVVIATKNRRADLLETTAAIMDQARSPNELIVVDQSDSDECGRHLKALLGRTPPFPLIYIWDRAIIGLPMARNRGFKASAGDLICYLDDDTTPAKDYLAQVERGFACFPEWGGLSGRFTQNEQLPVARRLGRCLFRLGIFRDERMRLGRIDSPREIRLMCGAACSFRREVLEQYQFDECLTGYALGEDVEFCLRAGRVFRFGAYPGAQWHHRRSSVGRLSPAEIRDMARASAAYLRRLHRRHAGDDLAYIWLSIGLKLDQVLSSWSARATFLQSSWLGYLALRPGAVPAPDKHNEAVERLPSSLGGGTFR